MSNTALETQVQQYMGGSPPSAAELKLAISRSREAIEDRALNEQVRIVIDAIVAYRKPFQAEAPLLLSDEQYRDLMDRVDRSARLELSKGSSSHEKLIKLDEEKKGIESEIAARELELSRSWNEFNGIPAAFEFASQRKSRLDIEKSSLNNLDQSIRDEYQALISSKDRSRQHLDSLTLAKIREPLIRPILDKELASVDLRIGALRHRNSVLAKELRTDAHNL